MGSCKLHISIYLFNSLNNFAEFSLSTPKLLEGQGNVCIRIG